MIDSKWRRGIERPGGADSGAPTSTARSAVVPSWLQAKSNRRSPAAPGTRDVGFCSISLVRSAGGKPEDVPPGRSRPVGIWNQSSRGTHLVNGVHDMGGMHGHGA